MADLASAIEELIQAEIAYAQEISEPGADGYYGSASIITMTRRGSARAALADAVSALEDRIEDVARDGDGLEGRMEEVERRVSNLEEQEY